MRKQYFDYRGKKFGKLTALEPLETFTVSGRRLWAWECRCDCGNKTVTRAQNLQKGHTKSCGCLKIETSKKNIEYTREATVSHGDSRRGKMHDLYKLYHCIKGRVKCDRIRDAKSYKDKGILVCDEWGNDYLAFKKWAIDNGYKKGLIIDRIDNSKGYSPNNCRFVTTKQSMRNTTRNRYLEINGERKTVVEWAEYYNVRDGLVRSRLRANWPVEEIFTAKPSTRFKKRKPIT